MRHSEGFDELWAAYNALLRRQTENLRRGWWALALVAVTSFCLGFGLAVAFGA